MHPAVAAATAFKAVHETGQVPDYERILRQGYSRFLAPGDVVVDVGAHTGLHLVAFADLVGPTGKVHAFEPIPFLMKDLARRFGRRPEVEPGMGADVDDDIPRSEEAAVALPQDALVVRNLTGVMNRPEGVGGGHGRMHAQGPFRGDKSGGSARSRPW